MLISKLSRQTGDTIIEVLIVLAILGLSFGISYATANKGLLASRSAEEHSEALQLIDAQVELLRQASSNSATNVFLSGGSFCMISANPPTPTYPVTALFAVPAVADNDSLTEYPPACVQGLYHESIQYYPNPPSGSQDVFTLYIRWTGLGGTNIQQEELTYKLHPGS
ncbi:MAG TPA: type II secretion system protein [Candidatus Dormibacteraeota bacterium]|nr:type II secretion system protein [Candidatus Dormibacteraeota bacterium]